MPTPAKHRVLDSARVVLEEIARTETVVRELAANRRGLLRVATECYACYHWPPDVLRDFERINPGVEARIWVEATARPPPELLGGRLDLALMTSAVRDRRLAATPLFRDEMLVIVPSGHRFTRQRFVRPADLAAETPFAYVPREESYVFEKLLAPAGVSRARCARRSRPKPCWNWCAPASA